MDTAIRFRWLGVAGIELSVNDQVLMIDPYLTRLPLWRVAFGRVRPNRELLAEKIQHCDFVLVTHAHFDHLMDVPDVVRNTGAVALGSANTCSLLATLGVPPTQIRPIEIGDQLALGDFRVEVLLAEHVTLSGWSPFSGPLPPNLRPPLRARDYRMDCCLGYLVRVDGVRLLHCPGPAAAAEVLFVKPLRTRPAWEALLHGVRPQIVVPVHWDDFARSLSRPVRSMALPSGRAIPPLRRINLTYFKDMVEQIVPEVKVIVPEMFHAYDLGELT